MAGEFSDLRAIFLNCSIKYDFAESHTRRLLARSAGIMDSQGVSIDFVHLLHYDIAFGMVKDARTESGRPADDWPGIQERIMAADILVLGTPIWLGVKSSVATMCIERMYAYSGDRNDKGQYLYYGKSRRRERRALRRNRDPPVEHELLATELFANLLEARVIIGDWRDEYNHRRPHSSLGWLAPAVYAATWHSSNYWTNSHSGWTDKRGQASTVIPPAQISRRDYRSGTVMAETG